jgi:hypothetical protein
MVAAVRPTIATFCDEIPFHTSCGGLIVSMPVIPPSWVAMLNSTLVRGFGNANGPASVASANESLDSLDEYILVQGRIRAMMEAAQLL